MTNEKTSNRAIVFIDGNNLYHRLKQRGWKTWIDVASLARRVVGGRQLVHIYYYNSYPPGGKPYTGKGNEYLAQLARIRGLTFRASRLQATTKSDENGQYQSYVEKGGDTALSADLVALAANGEYDVAIIISNDGDYEPSVRIVTEFYGKCVEVIYFEGSRPFVMESCTVMRAFKQSFLKEHDYPSVRRTRR